MIEHDAGQEVRRIIGEGEASGFRLRALGGLAVSLTCPSAAKHPRLTRVYADIDLVGLGRDGPRLGGFFARLGYTPDQRFNALHGLTRLLFYNTADGGHVDVFLDRFQMCHTLDLRRRLLDGYLTLAVADLLITKLQIVEMNLKDMQDCLAILLDHELGPEAPDHLDRDYLASLTSRDWGLFTTLGDNLRKVSEQAADFLLPEEAASVTRRVEAILQAMHAAPKSLGWNARAKIGRRMEWYDLPDEVRR